jgi:hypothetical protein
MNEERRCAIENISERSLHPFVSIKNNKDPSELVINPNGYADIDWRAEAMGFHQADDRWFEAICAECTLCMPTIEIDREARASIDGYTRYGLRIYRHKFLQENIVRSLYVVQTHALYNKNQLSGENRTRVCCIDDDKLSWEVPFNNTNTDVLAIWVDPNVRCTPLQAKALTDEIVQWNPDWLISDKGLGFVDGIELILRCKEAGIRTIMLTGEIQTDETRRVADVFLKKPVESEVFLDIMHIPFQR